MIEERFFGSFAFPWILCSDTGDVLAEGDGSLFPSPEECHTEATRRHCLSAPTGWSTCPAGYAVYSTVIPTPDNKKLVVYGIKVKGHSTTRGKSSRLSIWIQETNLEEYIESNIGTCNHCNNLIQETIRGNIHEIRSINTDIYNAAYNLRVNIDNFQFNYSRDFPLIGNIEALSNLQRTRTDYLDVISNPILIHAPGGKKPIYRAFDRLHRSLKPTADSNSVQIRLSGESIGKIEAIKLFDVIPYLILQNAIKYAPKNTYIHVDIRETDDYIFAKISSIGPLVESDELEKIFSSGYRGKNAISLKNDGSGVGLYFLKQLVEAHSGANIQFFQDSPDRVINAIPFAPTHINLRFKRAN